MDVGRERYEEEVDRRVRVTETETHIEDGNGTKRKVE